MQPGPALETADRKKVEVRHFSADRWGDSQAIAYIREKTVVVMVVLAARTPRSYESALPAFAEVVQSYKLMDEDVHE
jgi:peroxiredoxin